MHHLPRKLNVETLAQLFEGRTRFVERLAECADPLTQARSVLNNLSEDEQIEALNAHPPIGAPGRSATSAREQGGVDDPTVLAELARLNRAYEVKFGFRFVIFVNRRSKTEILAALRDRLLRSRTEELSTGLDELVAIAHERARAV